MVEARIRQLSTKQTIDEQRLRKAAVALLTVQVLWAVEDGAEEVEGMKMVLEHLSKSI